MKRSNEKALDNLINHTVHPVLYDDCKYSSEEEFEALKQYLIDAITETEYIDSDTCNEVEEHDDDAVCSRY
jgi:hypothetical protein